METPKLVSGKTRSCTEVNLTPKSRLNHNAYGHTRPAPCSPYTSALAAPSLHTCCLPHPRPLSVTSVKPSWPRVIFVTLSLVPFSRLALVPLGTRAGVFVFSTWQTTDPLHHRILGAWQRGLASRKYPITVSQLHFPQIHSTWCLSLKDACELRVSHN